MSVKRTLFYLHIGFMLVVMMISCKKDHTPAVETQTINVTIANTADYSYDLGSFGDEEGASISCQALHYQVSELSRINYGSVTYKYQPSPNYIGTDEVELKSARGSDGGSPNKIMITTIKFTIVTR